MPLTNPPSVPVIGTGYSMGWTTEQRSTPPYTATPASTPYNGGLLDLLQAARLTDLNNLRVAVENLRAFSEQHAAQQNALLDDMMAAGIIKP